MVKRKKALFETFAKLSARQKPRRYKIGLALSGGVAYGIAQVGVLKVLEKAGIRPDCIAGTSSGSLIAAGYAAGLSVKQLEALSIHTSWKQLFALRPSSVGLVSSEPIATYVRENFHVSDFSQLKIPLAVVATDICSGEEAVFTEGPLDRAVRASCSIPGVYGPVELAGCQLVDGGLAENVPVQALKSMGADLIIAVNVMGHPQVFKKASNLVQIMTRVWNFFIQQNRVWRKKADVILEPDLRIFDLFDFSAVPDIIRVGEREAKSRLPEMKRAIKRRDSLRQKIKGISKYSI